MPASRYHPRANELVWYTCPVPWTDSPSELPERPRTLGSASEAPSSSASSNTLGCNSPSDHHPSPDRSRSPSYCPETPTRPEPYRLQSPPPASAPSPPPYKPETPSRSPPAYTPETPSRWMTTLTINYAATDSRTAATSTSTNTTTTTTTNTNPISATGTTHLHLPSISSLLQNPTPPFPLPPPAQSSTTTTATRIPLSRPLHPARSLRPARSAANPPSPRMGVLYVTAGPEPALAQPMPRRALGIEGRVERWDGIIEGVVETSEEEEQEQRESSGEEQEAEREAKWEWDGGMRCFLGFEGRREEWARRRMERMRRGRCLRGMLGVSQM